MNKFFIEPEYEVKHLVRQPASYIRKEFLIDQSIQTAQLIMTACGLFHGYFNGIELDSQKLLPGFTQYDQRLQYFTYDVTNQLTKGANVIAAVLGDGWYRGDVGWYTGRYRNVYGKKTKFLAVLKIEYKDGSVQQINTDPTWKASQNGPSRKNSLVCGEYYNANFAFDGWNKAGFDDSEWHAVLPSEYNGTLVPPTGEKIREHEQFKPKIITTPNGETVLDFGQNIAGYVEFKVKGHKNRKVKLIHGERLDQDGNFFLPKQEKRSNYQSVTYTLKEGEQTFKPLFSYNGFQYVLLKNWPCEVVPDDFTAIAIYSDLEQTGSFTCSNRLLNQFVQNAIWSQKSNFVDIPTDCPTRERAGWTGDISLYGETASYLMKTDTFLKKWLKDLELQQSENGCVPSVVPYMKYPHFMDGSCGWSDAAVTVPMTLYSMYGDKELLKTQYQSMKKWVDFNIARAKKCAPENKDNANPYLNYFLDQGYHWGEWLEPNSDAWADIARHRRTAESEVATAYFSYSSRLLSQAAKILGKETDAQYYADISEKAANAYRWQYIEIDGGVQSQRQCRYVRPIALKVATEDQQKRLAHQLNEMIINNDYLINTGFLSTGSILSVLCDYGYEETAYRMLLNETDGTWLSQVKHGATTIWEQWDGESSRNHYAFGSVVGWLFKYSAGIRPLEPGFSKVLIKPTPSKLLNDVSCKYQSVAGEIAVDWSICKTQFKLKIQTPTAAVVIMPDQKEHHVQKGTYTFLCNLPSDN